MRNLLIISLMMLCMSCDDARVFEQYHDFDEEQWKMAEKPKFDFVIDDPSMRYNVYSNVRNSVSYPWSRFFMNYTLQDSTGAVLKQNLLNEFLFHAKSGEPFGNSGLGDIFDHQFLLLKDFQFPYKGKFTVEYQHYMRTDSLEGILAVGLRVERATK
ncbi:gliding motility lipoprotein GldH [Pseudochryseolinea flava]|uniref:Gliding motility lipoprotein GldH n=1 Tax=Pseudochryseolinea flava TaxID=2059302 RepID=A0A364Y6I7_9BACT|nr:gliding motility lipoprotein GldH [Pseudochryseolinea flava]RAW02671.1 gliding motility lipoprotein GldH [Pseudochryseolinea flava]